MKAVVVWAGLFASALVQAATLAELPLSMRVDDDLPYSAALYAYEKGNYQEVLQRLASAELTSPAADDSHRQLLAGKASLQLELYEDAQRHFDAVSGMTLSDDLQNQLMFPLARLNYAKGRCHVALAELEGLQALTPEQADQARFMRVSCLLRQGGDDPSVIAKAERILAEPIVAAKGKFEGNIWYAYGFYNLGAAASQNAMHADADRLYQEALKYTGQDDEGRALAERIRLSLAYTNYAINRFDFAMKSFAQMKMDGLWADKSLLGYGWSAFRNYKPGLALEAWRQLIYLPYKSISVYEGYIAIPFALEKANAFSDALEAYDTAIREYDEVIGEIQALEQTLSLQKIREHALDYAAHSGEAVKPLHPLLGYTYAQDDFRSAVELIGELAAKHQRISDKLQNIAILSEAYHWDKQNQGKERQHRQQEEQKITARLEALQQHIHALSDTVLSRATAHITDAKWQQTYQAYQALQAKLSHSTQERDIETRLAKIRGVLFWQLYEDDEVAVKQELQKVVELTRAYQHLYNHFIAYNRLEKTPIQQAVDEAELQALQQRVSDLKQKTEKTMTLAEQQLLDKTLQALAEHKQRILFFQKQARVASARLHEEFYQRGGHKL